MEVILLERIERLGQMGDIVQVKNGYARNFLLPQKKALRKTKDNLALFESKRKEYEAYNLKLKSEAEQLSEKMKNLSVVIIRQAAETGQLYGSVTVRDICDAIKEAGFKVERRQIDLPQPFKNLGIFDVRLSLHPDVDQTVRVNVARSAEEAKRSASKHQKRTAEAGSSEPQADAKSAGKAETAEVSAVKPAETGEKAEKADAKPAKTPAED